jgi:hypothetical protein
LSDWQILRKIVERHAEVLEEGWMKKTRKKQKEILLEAWPNMSASHRPDFGAYRQENTGRHWMGLSNFQEGYMWPYINQDDLSTRSLVVFILSRARNPRSMFAHADIDATRLGSIGHFIPELIFLSNYTLFMNCETPQTYGRVVSWDDDPSVANVMFEQRQFSPGEVLRVFELQAKIYSFLVKCRELILHNFVVSGSLFGENFPTIPESSVAKATSATTTDMLPSLASISAEAPYRLPVSLDLERLRAIIAARLSAAEDHLWAFRGSWVFCRNCRRLE